MRSIPRHTIFAAALVVLASWTWSPVAKARLEASQVGQGAGTAAPAAPQRKRLLALGDTHTGFTHDSIGHALAVIDRLGRESGLYDTYIRTDSQWITKQVVPPPARNARNLDYFDAVFFLGSGEGTLSPRQKTDLLSYVHDDGKGLVLGHAQGVNFYNWPEWGTMIGGFMASEFPITGMYAKVTDPSWKAAAAFGKGSFFWADQWPVLKPAFKRGDVHTIVALDPARMTPEQRARANRPDDYLPIVWAKSYGKGRVFNMTGGHNDATLDDPKTQALLLEGIEWALGLRAEDASPDK